MALNAEVLTSYKKIDEAYIDELLKKEIEKNNKKIVVLDDDPTGVQTVHDISVYTNWEKDTIRQGFDEENNLFYVLTNSRGFTAEQTTKAHNEIAAVVDEVAKETGKEYIFISRSDSTLRGHYPLETELLKKNYEANTGKTIDGEILCPFFKEGGRYTIDNVHYVKYGEELIPANETEFAKDKTFGYSAATMPEYVEEKTKGAYKASDVTCISLEDIHDMNIDKIEEALMEVKDFNKIIVNAVDYADVKVFCVALYRAMAKGKVFMFRTAAAIVKVMGGVTDQPLLSREQMVVKETDNGGIIVVGSHTDKTTKQAEELKKLTDIEFIELDATLVKDDEAFEKEVKRCLNLEETCIKAGKSVCCITTRALITADSGDKEDELRLSVKISDAVQSLVGRLSVTPSFVIAKGGITSSDVGTKALAVKKANVLGQIKPGIPVWQTGEESKFPLTPYVIFPGNVGEVTTLREAVEVLTAKKKTKHVKNRQDKIGKTQPIIILPLLIATAMRFIQGSGTVAMTTAASITAPIIAASGVSPILGAVACCVGSLFFGYFNDSYFWVVNRTLGVSEAKDQLTIWSVTSTVAWAVGVVEVLILNIFM